METLCKNQKCSKTYPFGSKTYPSVLKECPYCEGFGGKYNFIEALGSGAWGTVYLAKDNLEGKVALKLLENRVSTKKFFEEAKNLRKLNHPNIVSLYEAEEAPVPYLVMEYIEGGNLKARISEGITLQEIATISKKLADALVYAHRMNIVHLDINPRNIMMNNVNEREEPKLVDFGLSRMVNNEAIMQMSAVSGTPAYMAPEQLKNEYDKRTDIFLLGGTMYEMLTNEPPFAAENVAQAQYKILNEKPIFTKSRDQSLEAICLKCLEKDPNNRYQTAKELKEALSKFLKALKQKESEKEEDTSSEEISTQEQPSTNTIKLISKERRKGDSLDVIFNQFLKTNAKEMETKTKIFPFRTVSPLQDGEYLDFTTEEWVALGKNRVENQIKNATAYQIWYAKEKKVKTKKEFLLNEKVKISMMLIPPGKYWQGTSEVRRKVLISEPFWCGKYPVTQEQWESVMNDQPSHFNKGKETLQNPVECVSWDDCQAFCKRSDMNLLSEIQWEYACRAGTTTKYHFGNNSTQLDDYAWYLNNSKKKTHPVGKKKPNAWGLRDMHGNIWEWCQDSYKDWVGAKGWSFDSDRVVRGGSWGSTVSLCSLAFRHVFKPSNYDKFSGFRLMRLYP